MVYYQSNGPNTINITNKVSKEPIIIAFGGGYYIYAMYVSISLHKPKHKKTFDI